MFWGLFASARGVSGGDAFVPAGSREKATGFAAGALPGD